MTTSTSSGGASLALHGSVPNLLRQALSRDGFEVHETISAQEPVLVFGSAAVLEVKRQGAALVVAACEPLDWEPALRAGAYSVVPLQPNLVVAACEHALTIARERAELHAFRKAAALAVPGSTLADLEQAAILAAMKAAHGNTAKAAAMLDISVRKVQYKLHDYGMPPTRKRAENEALWGSNGANGTYRIQRSEQGSLPDQKKDVSTH